MKNIIFLLLLILSTASYSQSFTISGYVKEELSAEVIAGVSIFDSLSQTGVRTNEYGFFSLSVPKKKVRLIASIFIFETFKETLILKGDTSLNILLKPRSISEVEITDETVQNSPLKLNRLQVSLQELKALPALLSEKDLLKSLALTPGVSLGSEGSSGLLVRGGSPDQNLILLDDATVYNASHLFGFVSIFNMDAIKSVELYKGGFPAQYGGRLSSVLDIRMKEGNRQKREGKASIGLISSNVSAEGPLNKGKSSYFLSGRASYLSLISLPILLSYRAGGSESYFNYWLYDINAKVNHSFKDGSQLYVSMYSGLDNYDARERNTSDSEGRFGLNWGNTTGTIRYNRILGPKVFLKSIISASNYFYQIDAQENSKFSNSDTSVEIKQSTKVISKVRDLSGKLSIDWYPFSHTNIRAGVEAVHQRFRPGTLEINSEEQEIDESVLQNFPTYTYSAFLENEISLFSRLRFHAGLRASSFQTLDTSIQALEPRLLLQFNLGSTWSMQAAYSIMRQNMHLLSSNGVGLPNDIWVPATAKTGIAVSEQYSLGLLKNLAQVPLTISFEAYHKSLNGLIDYRAGAGALSNFSQNWEEQIETQGIGEAYGFETMVHKKAGKLTGWLAYTLSWNKQRFANINKGAWFPGRFDRRHDIAIAAFYELSEHWKLSANWVYNSGPPVTLPIGVLRDAEGIESLIYQDRNNARFPAYHRLDFGAEYKVRPEDKSSPVWSFSIYNLYNRQNPFFLQLEKAPGVPGDPDRFNIIQQSLFPIIPSLSYSWHF
ncbi:MAG: TonB-dependent receptor [Bacteroidota bacterium]